MSRIANLPSGGISENGSTHNGIVGWRSTRQASPVSINSGFFSITLPVFRSIFSFILANLQLCHFKQFKNQRVLLSVRVTPVRPLSILPGLVKMRWTNDKDTEEYIYRYFQTQTVPQPTKSYGCLTMARSIIQPSLSSRQPSQSPTARRHTRRAFVTATPVVGVLAHVSLLSACSSVYAYLLY